MTDRSTGAAILIGQVLPSGAKVASVTLDGRTVAYQVRQTSRGTEVVTGAKAHHGPSVLVITLH